MLSQPDSQFVKRNRVLPGLGFLFDPGLFSRYMEKSIPEIKIDVNEAGYVRYKPGTNCLVGYHATYKDTQSYIYGTTYAPHSPGKLKKAKTAFLVEKFFSVVSIFPYDRKLGSLKSLSGREQRERLFEELLPGKGKGASFSLKGLRYKPERRFVGKLTNKNSGESVGVVKFYRDCDFTTAKIAAESFRSTGNLQVPKLLSSSAKNHALVFDWDFGKPLEDIIYQENFNVATLKNMAKALGEIHSHPTGQLKKIAPSVEARRITDAASMLSLTIPSLGERAVLLAGRLSHLLSRKRGVSTPVHGDFYAGQVLLGKGESVTVVDFDRAALGDPALDIGTLFAHFEREFVKGKIAQMRLSEFKKSFLDGYLSDKTSDFTLRVCIYTAAELFRLAQEPFRHREREWAETTLSMLNRTDSLLEELKGIAPHKSFAVPVTDPYNILKPRASSILESALSPGVVEKGIREFKNITLPKPQIQTIRVIRYKLFRRCMIEYDLASGLAESSGLLTVIGKIRCRGLDISSYQVQSQLWNNNFRAGCKDGILVPEPLGIIPDLNMLLYKKAEGVPVTGILPAEEGITAARAAARAAFKIHTSSVSPKRVHTLSDEIRTLDEKLPLVAKESPELEKRINRTLSLTKPLAASLPEPSLAPIHRDFYSDQLLSGENSLYVLDFDLFSLGDPALDIGNFIGHIREQSLRTFGDPDAMKETAEAVSEEYLRISGRDLKRSIEGYTLLTMVRHIYISTLFSDRRRLTLPLVTLCEKEIREFLGY